MAIVLPRSFSQMKLEAEESRGNFELKSFISSDSIEKGKDDGHSSLDTENGNAFPPTSFNPNRRRKSSVF